MPRTYCALTVPQILFSVYHYVQVSESCSVVSTSLWPHGPYSPWISAAQNTGMGSLFLLQGIFLTKGSKPGLLHCRRILYQLSYQGSLWRISGLIPGHCKKIQYCNKAVSSIFFYFSVHMKVMFILYYYSLSSVQYHYV